MIFCGQRQIINGHNITVVYLKTFQVLNLLCLSPWIARFTFHSILLTNLITEIQKEQQQNNFEVGYNVHVNELPCGH